MNYHSRAVGRGLSPCMSCILRSMNALACRITPVFLWTFVEGECVCHVPGVGVRIYKVCVARGMVQWSAMDGDCAREGESIF